MLQARCAKVTAERDALRLQVGITPERVRKERATLQAKAKK